MTKEQVIACIVGGVLDADLAEISTQIADRRKLLQYRAIHTLVPGEEIRISPTVRPRYLALCKGKVVRVMQTYVEFDLDEPVQQGHKRWYTGIRLPMSLVLKREQWP